MSDASLPATKVAACTSSRLRSPAAESPSLLSAAKMTSGIGCVHQSSGIAENLGNENPCGMRGARQAPRSKAVHAWKDIRRPLTPCSGAS